MKRFKLIKRVGKNECGEKVAVNVGRSNGALVVTVIVHEKRITRSPSTLEYYEFTRESSSTILCATVGQALNAIRLYGAA